MDTDKVFDYTRQKQIALTPEEYVRQNVVCYLTETLQVPQALIRTEFALSVLDKKEKGRVDILVANPKQAYLTEPWLLAECKAKENASLLMLEAQVNKYLRILHPKHIILALGNELRFLSQTKDAKSYQPAQSLPLFPD